MTHTRNDTPMEMVCNSTMEDKLRYHDKKINNLKICMQKNYYKSSFPSKFQSTVVLTQDTEQNHLYEAVGPGDSANPKNLPQDNCSSGTQKGSSFCPQSQFPNSSPDSAGNSHISMENLQKCSGYKMEENHTNCHNISFIDDWHDSDNLCADDRHTNHYEADLQNNSTPLEKGW